MLAAMRRNIVIEIKKKFHICCCPVQGRKSKGVNWEKKERQGGKKGVKVKEEKKEEKKKVEKDRKKYEYGKSLRMEKSRTIVSSQYLFL